MAIRGLEQIKTNLAAVKARLRAAAPAALEAGGRDLLERSRALVPVKSGALRASGFVERRETVVVGYSAPYAAIVHEDLEAHHDNGRAKFLEEPAREGADRLLVLVGGELQKGAGL